MGYVEITALADGETVGLFAIPALFITLRETLEAAIVLSVLIGLLHRVGLPHLIKYVWFGVAAAGFLTVAGAIIVILLINVAKESIFEGDNDEVAEGAVSIVAAVLIAIVALSIGDISAIQEKIEAKMLARVRHNSTSEVPRIASPVDDEADAKGDPESATVAPGASGAIADASAVEVEVHEKPTKNLTISDLDEEDREEIENEVTAELMFFLAFTAVIREGLETIIFFTGITATYPPESLPIPALVGAIIGATCGVLLYRSSGKLTIMWFFRITMILLVFIGAGVWTNGMRELLEAGKFGTWEPAEERAPINQIVFDATACCGLDNQFWLLMRVLFGWNPEPTGFDFLMYFGFHLVLWTLVYIKMKRAREGKPGFKALIKYYICRRGEKPE